MNVKHVGMRLMGAMLVSLLCAGTATSEAGEIRRVVSDYTITPSNGTGVIRAFYYGSTTVIEFETPPSSFSAVDGDGNPVDFEPEGRFIRLVERPPSFTATFGGKAASFESLLAVQKLPKPSKAEVAKFDVRYAPKPAPTSIETATADRTTPPPITSPVVPASTVSVSAPAAVAITPASTTPAVTVAPPNTTALASVQPAPAVAVKPAPATATVASPAVAITPTSTTPAVTVAPSNALASASAQPAPAVAVKPAPAAASNAAVQVMPAGTTPAVTVVATPAASSAGAVTTAVSSGPKPSVSNASDVASAKTPQLSDKTTAADSVAEQKPALPGFKAAVGDRMKLSLGTYLKRIGYDLSWNALSSTPGRVRDFVFQESISIDEPKSVQELLSQLLAGYSLRGAVSDKEKLVGIFNEDNETR